MKISNDIRWLASGPRCGLGELVIPENERDRRSCREGESHAMRSDDDGVRAGAWGDGGGRMAGSAGEL